jgi:lysophospholipase L1-like esterase
MALPTSPPSRPRTRGSVLLALVLLVLAGCGTAGNPHPKNLDTYVALGDSYTALAGVGPFSDAACKRTTSNYPSLVAKDLGISRLADVSCGGATSAALIQNQSIQNPPASRPPQLEALSTKTKLVTIGIGLNDYELAYYLLYACIPINGITAPTCSMYLKQPQSTVSLYVENMAAQVKTNLKDIRKAAPNARIVLVGYPRILADGADCPAKLSLPAPAASRLRTILKSVNEQYIRLAEETKVDYVDMWSAKGHDVCSSDPWMAGQANVPGKALQFHPYETYSRAVADKIVALLKK